MNFDTTGRLPQYRTVYSSFIIMDTVTAPKGSQFDMLVVYLRLQSVESPQCVRVAYLPGLRSRSSDTSDYDYRPEISNPAGPPVMTGNFFKCPAALRSLPDRMSGSICSFFTLYLAKWPAGFRQIALWNCQIFLRLDTTVHYHIH